jgi:uronate dehydrogenase
LNDKKIEEKRERKEIVITGAAGRIGGVLRFGLRNSYRLRLTYHKNPIIPVGDEKAVFCDITDIESCRRAINGAKGVIHLAADPRVSAPWHSVLHNNIIGTFNVFEASRICGVKKIVFASSNHVTGFWEVKKVYTTPEMSTRPDSNYGVSKAFGEAFGRYYSDKYCISIICLRIGSFLGEEEPKLSGRHLSTWLSNRDMIQLTKLSLETDILFGIFYGISDNTRRYWDIGNAKRLLGYFPEDNAEDYR